MNEQDLYQPGRTALTTGKREILKRPSSRSTSGEIHVHRRGKDSRAESLWATPAGTSSRWSSSSVAATAAWLCLIIARTSSRRSIVRWSARATVSLAAAMDASAAAQVARLLLQTSNVDGGAEISHLVIATSRRDKPGSFDEAANPGVGSGPSGKWFHATSPALRSHGPFPVTSSRHEVNGLPLV